MFLKTGCGKRKTNRRKKYIFSAVFLVEGNSPCWNLRFLASCYSFPWMGPNFYFLQNNLKFSMLSEAFFAEYLDLAYWFFPVLREVKEFFSSAPPLRFPLSFFFFFFFELPRKRSQPPQGYQPLSFRNSDMVAL